MKPEQKDTPLNILLADDDHDDRFFFANAIKGIPIASHLTTVNDGEELMKYLSANSGQLPDILFLDLSMPRKTGFECLSEIKESKVLKDIPVIVFTTSFGRGIDFEDRLIDILSTIGAQEYVRKPNDLKELEKIIHNAFIKAIEKRSLKEQEKNS